MELNFVKVLPILLLVLVGAKGAIPLTKPSDDVYSMLSRLAHDTTDLTKGTQELKSEIAALKDTIQLLVNSSPHQMPQSAESLSGSVRNVSKLYTSCVEALQNGSDSGIYTLQIPFTGLEPFNVYCLKDPDNGPAWTVVQRRQDGSVDFYRNWAEYQRGFGNLNGEFFLGMQYLYALTNQRKPQELWIELADWEGATKTAKYSQFQIGPELSNYTMTLVGGYSGNAGDALTYHRGMQFSTKDRDNDKSPNNCAEVRKGAWWFNFCMNSHLNGEYLRGVLPQTTAYFDKGVNWLNWRGDHYSNKYSHMALRPSS